MIARTRSALSRATVRASYATGPRPSGRLPLRDLQGCVHAEYSHDSRRHHERFRWVLGSAGLPLTLLIVTLSVTITLLKGLSIAAMATNMKVGGGGAYYMTRERWASRSVRPWACLFFWRRP